MNPDEVKMETEKNGTENVEAKKEEIEEKEIDTLEDFLVMTQSPLIFLIENILSSLPWKGEKMPKK